MGRKVQNGASLVVGGYVRVWATGGFWDALITIPRAEARAENGQATGGNAADAGLRAGDPDLCLTELVECQHHRALTGGEEKPRTRPGDALW